MENLCSTLPKQENHEVFPDNFFTSLSLIELLKSDSIWCTGSNCAPHLKNYPLLAEKYIKKKERGSFNCHTERNRKIVRVKWFNNKVVTLASSYFGIEPTDTVRHYDCSIRQHFHVSRTNIVRLYNQYMKGIDKLDMMCSFYKPTFRSRRCYINF